MRCPNKKCRRETSRTITAFPASRKTGKVKKVEGCPYCFQHQVDAHVYTGRKIWHAYEAYGVAKTKQMNKDWGEKLKQRAARNRRDTANISEGAFNYLVDQTQKGLIRGRRVS